jgi:hypothetical protein
MSRRSVLMLGAGAIGRPPQSGPGTARWPEFTLLLKPNTLEALADALQADVR